MFNFLDENFDLLLRYSKYYLALSGIAFLLLGSSGMESITQRSVLGIMLLLAYFICYNASDFYVKILKKTNKHIWEKTNKILKIQLNFFIVFFTIGIFLFLAGSILNFDKITLFLLFINIPIGLVFGSVKAKKSI